MLRRLKHTKHTEHTKQKCHWLLTVANGVWGGALERGDRSADRDVLGQHFCDLNVDALARQVPRLDLVVLIVAQRRKDGAPTLSAELVATEAANKGHIAVSAAADTFQKRAH